MIYVNRYLSALPLERRFCLFTTSERHNSRVFPPSTQLCGSTRAPVQPQNRTRVLGRAGDEFHWICHEFQRQEFSGIQAKTVWGWVLPPGPGSGHSTCQTHYPSSPKISRRFRGWLDSQIPSRSSTSSSKIFTEIRGWIPFIRSNTLPSQPPDLTKDLGAVWASKIHSGGAPRKNEKKLVASKSVKSQKRKYDLKIIQFCFISYN